MKPLLTIFIILINLDFLYFGMVGGQTDRHIRPVKVFQKYHQEIKSVV